MPDLIAPEHQIYKVSQLNTAIRTTLETNFPTIWLEGEISNLSIPSSGHIYFSLKDNMAQVRCVMFRNYQQKVTFQFTNGLHLVVQAQVSLYEPRGDYQLIVYNAEPAGEGMLHLKFIQLKNKLAAAGLFDQEHKKPLPKLPNRIGIITSPTGAAIHDILSVLKRRFASIPIVIYPTAVQGNLATEQIVQALALANKHQACDVLILSRGGGSLEDLWPFNEEVVARAIFASDIPVISAVGHEIDFTIADFVADQRAATPSAAAELAVVDVITYLNTIAHFQQRLASLMKNYIYNEKQHLIHVSERLHHPKYYIQKARQQLDLIEYRLKIEIKHRLSEYKQQLLATIAALDLVSPLATLARGYAIINKQDKVINQVAAISPGDKITARLSDGTLHCHVDKISETH